MNSKRKGKTLGVLGTVIGLIALGVGLLHMSLGPIEEPAPVESYVADVTVKIKDAISAKLKGEEYKAPITEKTIDRDQLLYQGVMIGGFIALALGAIGISLNEEWRPSGVAFVLGGAAITLQLSLAFLGALLIILIIGAIVSSLGLDISI